MSLYPENSLKRVNIGLWSMNWECCCNWIFSLLQNKHLVRQFKSKCHKLHHSICKTSLWMLFKMAFKESVWFTVQIYMPSFLLCTLNWSKTNQLRVQTCQCKWRLKQTFGLKGHKYLRGGGGGSSSPTWSRMKRSAKEFQCLSTRGENQVCPQRMICSEVLHRREMDWRFCYNK